MLTIGARFARVEPRRRARAFVRGLLAGLPRTNCWTIAEHAGEQSPRGMQRLLKSAVVDDGGLRDDLRGYVTGHLGDLAAVLVVDETGDVKKGTATAGVQRQYTGTAGRIENAQVAVYLAYAAPRGYAFIDRALYLPRSWTDDPSRCQAADVPRDEEFATKPALALVMIDRAVAAGAPARWAAGDEVYGNDPKLRAGIAASGLGFVLAVAKDHRIATPAGTRRAIDLAVCLPGAAWQRMSAGDGAKGPRLYYWAYIETVDPALPDDAQGANWLLIRRPLRTAPGAKAGYAFYRAHAPGPVPLRTLVAVAGTRWKVEESFAGGKELTALDQHQVRSWTSWMRWTVLAMLAHAFLSVMTAAQPAPEPGGIHRDLAGHELIPLTRNEIRRLFTGLLHRSRPARDQLHWSCWRRRHQATARNCHYQRRQALAVT
ncbi:MAG TPA: IS701 family transposase [Streptosporangiaceae bacterium]|nr:IS701 family transposase [Streptosporangiaceae bacterium]